VLAAWLVASPAWFDHAGWYETFLGVGLGLLVVWSLLRPDGRLHLWELVVAAAMIAVGWAEARGGQPTAAAQNLIVVGLLAATFCIVPTRAAVPPPAWRGD
jgi:hypothetical protein